MITDDKVKEYVKRLILARMHILNTHGFFGLLLMHAQFALDFEIETAATDGDKIYFSPKFMDSLTNEELEFVLMHEIMHIAFGHYLRQGNKDHFLFNVACDIVVNSNILQSNNWDLKSITLYKWGESMHLTPDKEEGCEYTAEQVYEMLLNNASNMNIDSNITMQGSGSPSMQDSDSSIENNKNSSSKNNKDGNSKDKNKKSTSKNSGWDNHDKWKDSGEELSQEERDKNAVWENRIRNACEAVQIRKENTGVGDVPLLAERKLKELKEAQIDWREILSSFIQEEVNDYSFSPPDKRYYDSSFFMPDFNDAEISVKNILFMIDTSGSMSDEMITQAYSEIKGAIDQFDGKLQGFLGFFEFEVVDPVPFYDEESFKIIKPKGGGGTSFDCIFDYVKKEMIDDLPQSIVILTDGGADFPNESKSLQIPVLWIINNEVVTPPWGKVARIKE